MIWFLAVIFALTFTAAFTLIVSLIERGHRRKLEARHIRSNVTAFLISVEDGYDLHVVALELEMVGLTSVKVLSTIRIITGTFAGDPLKLREVAGVLSVEEQRQVLGQSD